MHIEVIGGDPGSADIHRRRADPAAGADDRDDPAVLFFQNLVDRRRFHDLRDGGRQGFLGDRLEQVIVGTDLDQRPEEVDVVDVPEDDGPRVLVADVGQIARFGHRIRGFRDIDDQQFRGRNAG